VISFVYKGETYTIVFEDEKTTADKIVHSLESGGFKVNGKPVFK